MTAHCGRRARPRGCPHEHPDPRVWSETTVRSEFKILFCRTNCGACPGEPPWGARARVQSRFGYRPARPAGNPGVATGFTHDTAPPVHADHAELPMDRGCHD